MSQPLLALLSLAASGTDACLENQDPGFPFSLAKAHLATDLGLPRGKVTSAHLHANHRIDEEQHGYEEGDIGQCLEEGSSWFSAHLSPLPHTDCSGIE